MGRRGLVILLLLQAKAVLPCLRDGAFPQNSLTPTVFFLHESALPTVWHVRLFEGKMTIMPGGDVHL